MFKFETKPVMGKLQICVSKETRTINKEQQQRRPLSGQKLKHQSNQRHPNSEKLRLRPHSTPQTSSVNLKSKNIHDATTITNNVIRKNKNSIETAGSQCQSADDTEIVGTTIEQLVSKSIHTNDKNTSPSHSACQTNSTKEETIKTSVGCGTEDVILSIAQTNESENVSEDIPKTEKINYLEEGVTTSAIIEEVPKRMSLLEQKRLQWAAEKAQMHEWNPWGRPGGGAPHTISYTCDKTKSNYSNSDHIFSNYPDDNISKLGGGRLPPLLNTAPNSNPTSFRILQAATFSTMGLIDNSVVQNGSYDALKEESRRQWLEDLELQREEQRLRKIQDKSYYHKNLNDMNIENTVNNNLDSCSINRQLTKHTEPEIITSGLSPTLYSLEANNWNYNNSSSQRTFLRGANIPLDPETQKELAKKRETALEHQKAIQSQLEDRLRIKREEKERERKEELEEELRLRQEREQLEQQYVQDQQQLKPPQKSPEDDNCTQRKELKKHPSTKPQNGLSPQLPDVLDGTKQLENKTKKINTSEQDLNDSQEYLLRPPSINHTPYVNNRVLTPTKYREKHLFTRDFSTQTDFMPKATFPLRKNKGTTTTMKTTSIDEDSDTNSNETSSNDRGKQRNKSKTSRKKTNREKPRWGANQPSRNYKTQSEKYLSSEMKLNQKKTKEQQEEYTKKDDEKTKSRQRPSGKKTRSSAEHQRKLLAQEEGVTLNSQRICLTPLPSVRPMATGSSVTHDDLETGESLPTRRQRRQWQSPSRDEMPAFYTDSPLLPDVRNVRRGTTSNNGQSKDQQRRPTSQSLQQEDIVQEPYRTDSPPVPALRNKLANPNIERLCIKSPDASLGAKPKDTNNLALASNLTQESVNIRHLNDETTSNIFERLSTVSRFSVDDVHRSYTAPSHIHTVSTSPTSFPWQAQNYDHRIDILKKLTLVRQGLVLKQKQLEDMVTREPKSKEPYS